MMFIILARFSNFLDFHSCGPLDTLIVSPKSFAMLHCASFLTSYIISIVDLRRQLLQFCKGLQDHQQDRKQNPSSKMHLWENYKAEAKIRRVILSKHGATPLLLGAKIMQEADQAPHVGRQSNEVKAFLPTSLSLLFKH